MNLFAEAKKLYAFCGFVSAIGLCAGVTPSAHAEGFDACRDHFYAGQSPEIDNPGMNRNTFPLCYEGFAVLYSGISFTGLWSAEHLTSDHIEDAMDMKRVNAFHPDSNIPDAFRSELSDYSHTGYDRGHLTPSGDEWDSQSQQETFTLANMIPQNPDNNRNLWEGIESVTRQLAEDDGEIYVVTGPIFTKKLKVGRLLVPTMIFKAIYDPSKHKAAAYIVANGPGNRWTQVPIPYLIEFTRINPFPGLSDSEIKEELPLPWPRPHDQNRGIPPGTVSPDDGGVPGSLVSHHKSQEAEGSAIQGTSENQGESGKEEMYGAIFALEEFIGSEVKKEAISHYNDLKKKFMGYLKSNASPKLNDRKEQEFQSNE